MVTRMVPQRALFAGYDVTGVFMRNWDPHDADSRCDLDADETDAKWVCDTLGIPFTTVDFVKPYWHNVFRSVTSASVPSILVQGLTTKTINMQADFWFLNHLLKEMYPIVQLW